MTGRVHVDGLHVAYGNPPRAALTDADLTLPGDALVAVVGPSGSGKTTLLRALAGLETPTAGRVTVDDTDVTHTPPARRPTALVLQGDALLPDLTVADNVAYGLTLRDVPAAARAERLDVALLQFGLTGVAHLHPHELSGGQARRVALARAWILRPAVLLLDEPLAGLDTTLRRHVLDLVVRTRRRLGGTVVHVTHDLGEALSTADVLVVLRDGRIRQVGPPEEVYTRPADAFVADLVGPAGFLSVDVLHPRPGDPHGTARVHLWGADRVVPAHPDTPRRAHRATLLARPHAVTLRPLPGAATRPEIRGPVGLVQDARYLGERRDYVVETDAGPALAAGGAPAPPPPRRPPPSTSTTPSTSTPPTATCGSCPPTTPPSAFGNAPVTDRHEHPLAPHAAARHAEGGDGADSARRATTTS